MGLVIDSDMDMCGDMGPGVMDVDHSTELSLVAISSLGQLRRIHTTHSICNTLRFQSFLV